LGYIVIIFIGTILLILPIATVEGKQTYFLDALFTATSATAVTGLIVRNTAEHWTGFGQTVIMILIQIGGFGFMTTTSMIFLILGKRLTLKDRLLIKEDLNSFQLSGIIRLTRYIILLTFIFEFLGTFFLYMYFRRIMPSLRAIYFGLFHSISAFNNAGFDIFGNSLENFTNSTYINITISLLFIIGGLGFIVIAEIYRMKRFRKFSLHAKIVISMTVILIIISTLFIFVLEYNNPRSIGNLKTRNKFIASFFQGVTPRTAGFNTIPINYFRDVSLFFIIILMFIGASPGSTGGGVKTTTIATLLIVVYNIISRKKDIEVFEKRFKKRDIYKTLTIVVISLSIVSLVTIILSITEEFIFLQILFEVFSAFGTVGLSTGITPELTALGRVCIIITMFIGRVGPFTLAIAFGRKRLDKVRYPEEDILIG